MIDLAPYLERVASFDPLELRGTVRRVVGLSIVASGPAVPVGRCCEVRTRAGRCLSLVVGFREDEVLLQPLGRLDGIRPGDEVIALARGLEVMVGPGLRGRVVDALGRPLDRPEQAGIEPRSVDRDPPDPLSRRAITEVLETRIKAIDALFTVGKGQRLGIFSGSGVGKSVLLGELAKNARADVSVIGLIGERGREVGDFLHKVLGPEGLARSVLLVATSDRPAVERVAAAATAQTIAEYFRDQGQDVLLMMDSLTRLCQAQREIGLATGEPPSVHGYPPSAFAMLPRLLERAGTDSRGSITAVYSVLIDADDENDPVADTVRAILDGHLFLDRRMAGRGLYPAIDPNRSISRLMIDLVSEEENRAALDARENWSEFERVRDLVEIGAYQSGSDSRVDRALRLRPTLEDFVRQPMGTAVDRREAVALLAELLAENGEDG